MIVCPSCRVVYDERGTRFCGRCGADLKEVQPTAPTEPNAVIDPMIGRVIDSRYRVLARIGQGGMGAVYRVEHLAMGKLAAMKVLHSSLTPDREVAQRFRREAEAVSRLSSPHTVQVFDFGQAGGGSSYLVMELIKGEDLGAILRRDGPLSFARLAPLVMQVCEALSEAHEAGIIHRDLKPENLLVARARDGRDVAKVVDFGLAKLRGQEELNAVTARGSLVGTPFYMSPEQIRAEELDARSDVYSLGALMYRLLTGAHPFTAISPVAVLTQHLMEPLVPPSLRAPERAIAPEVDAIIVRAMAKSREERFDSADELRRALAAVSAGPPLPSADANADRRRRSDGKEPSGATALETAEALKREDFDRYERALKRRRWLALSLVPLAFLGSVGAAVWWARATTVPPVRGVEREPNNRADQANRIASGQPIRGQIGQRLSQEESDRDFFVFDVAEPSVLKADVTGLPNMDLVLELYDSRGNKEAEANNGGVDDDELIPNRRVAPGEHYLVVRQVWVAGQPATENVSDEYTLTATWRPPKPGSESEPNDGPAEATPIAPGTQLFGHFASADDVDYYRVDGDGGPYAATVRPTGGMVLQVTLLPKSATSGPPGPLPPGAKQVTIGAGGDSVPDVAAGQILAVACPKPCKEVRLPDKRVDRAYWLVLSR